MGEEDAAESSPSTEKGLGGHSLTGYHTGSGHVCVLHQRTQNQMWIPFSVDLCALRNEILGFPGGAVVENLPANAGDMGSSPGLGRSHVPRSN